MRLLAAAIMLVSSLLAIEARADDPISIRLLNGGYSGSTGTALLGLEVDMPEGWHTYWKTAGEGGFAPEIDTSNSDNLDSFDTKWPAPEKIETPTVPGTPAWQTNGYLGKVVIPVLARPKDLAKPMNVRIALRLYACKDYCSAFERTLVATVASGDVINGDQRIIADWLKRVPRSAAESLSISPPEANEDGTLSVTLNSTMPLAKPWLHVANADNIPYTVNADMGDPRAVRFIVTPQDGQFEKSDKLEFVATADGRAVAAIFDRPTPHEALGWSVVLTAFLGGLILNVMPCVFPVLSLKLMALTAGNAKTVQTGFAASALGIVGSFILLGAVLAAMKQAGVEIGWGIQFQSPIFLGSMAIIVMTFALGAAGLFEISLPHGLATKATRLTDGHGFGASLSQGFVTTLLATPCSAPFVGTAVGFALAGGTIQILVIFAAMGIGMALPYLLISVLPGLARVLPKPGVWMQRVRQALSLALFTTAGWLIAMLASVPNDTVGVIALTTAAGVIIGAMVRWASTGRKGRSAFIVIAAIAFSAPGTVYKLPADTDGGIAWQAFRPTEIKDLVGRGKTVVVYVTAEWCITCKVNDRTTWRDAATVNLIKANAVPMKADWTRPDPAISAFLKEHGRFGIPFTMIYSPQEKTGMILPEILTPLVIEKALKP
jgi:suppressor for copper-sensitivity B